MEQVPCAQNRVNRVALSQPEQFVDCFYACPRQLGLILFPKERKAPAEVPVSRMQDLQCHVLFLHGPHSRTNSTSRILATSGGRYRRWCARSRHWPYSASSRFSSRWISASNS